MKIEIISEVIKGEEIPVNEKGFEEMEIDSMNDVNAFSFNKNCRYIGIGKRLFRLSLKSYKQLKKYLQKTNSAFVRTV